MPMFRRKINAHVAERARYKNKLSEAQARVSQSSASLTKMEMADAPKRAGSNSIPLDKQPVFRNLVLQHKLHLRDVRIFDGMAKSSKYLTRFEVGKRQQPKIGLARKSLALAGVIKRGVLPHKSPVSLKRNIQRVFRAGTPPVKK